MANVPGEPRFTIYGPAWDDARAGVARLSSARLRREYGAVLDHLESGWALVRPLQMEAETIMRWQRSGGGAALSVADFIDLSVTDEFRDVAFRCREALRGDLGSLAELSSTVDEAEVVERALLVLGMAAEAPEFPAGLRQCAQEAVEPFGEWVCALRGVLAPLERRADAGAPVAASRLRVVE